MLRNYLNTALRTLRRHAGYTLLNVTGIAVGLATCLLIGTYVWSEWSYDHFHDASDRIYRAWVDETYEDRQFTNTITPLPLGPALASSLPEVQTTVRISAREDLVRRGDTQFRQRIHAVEPGFFAVFDFPLVRGDPATALADPGSVVLTEAVAQTYFGDADPLGRTIEIQEGDAPRSFTVTGIAAPPPIASSIQFDILTPFRAERFSPAARAAWFRVSVETYVLLHPDADVAAVRQKLPGIVREAIGAEEMAESQYTIGLQPITAIHLDPSLPPGLEPTSRPIYSILLFVLGALILAVACINFVTLAVGRATERAREVGMRKVVGAYRRQLMAQFWGEAVLTTGLALGLSLGLARIARPVFETLAGRPLTIDVGFTLLLAAGLWIVGSLLAGGYPAAVLARLQPVDILKGRLPLGTRRGVLRGLVGAQIGVSVVLLIGLFVMQQQIRYLQTTPLGFETEQIVTLPTTGTFDGGMQVFDRLRRELQAAPGVVDVAASSFTPDRPWMMAEFEAEEGRFYRFQANLVSHDYVETMGIDLVAGRSFSREMPSDTSRGLLVNAALVAEMGWTPEDAVGRRLPGLRDHAILGVTANFHYASLHQPVEPLVLAAIPELVLRGAANVGIPGSLAPQIAVRLAPDQVRPAMDAVEAAWTRVAPAQPFAYTFLDDAVDQQYRQEQRFTQIVAWASGLALAIAGFGLFALVVLVTQHRRKEIGIRRTLGATVPSIVGLVSWDFVKVVATAFGIAAPVAYLAADRWLQDFAYHVDPGVQPFVLAAGVVLLVTLLTVGTQALRSAHDDPARVLRTSGTEG